MKVLFTFGGIPLYLNRLLERLVEKQVEVIVVTPAGESDVIGKNVEMSRGEKKYKVIRTPEKKSRKSRKPHFPQLKEILAKEKPDIVVLGWPYFLDVRFNRKLLQTIRKENIKLIIREIPFQVPPYREAREWFKTHPVYDESMNLQSTGLAFRIKSALLRRVRRFVYTHADAAINYASTGKSILPGYGIPEEKIFVTYNSPDVEALWKQQQTVSETPRLWPENPHRILHIGRLVKWKRVDLLIAATRRLTEKFPDIELVVVGNGPELENLKKQAEEAGIAGRVQFTGAVYDPMQLVRYMCESAIYVLAGMGGLSINEAMACSLPVVCSVCDGTEKDLIVPGQTGMFFRDGDTDSLAETLEELLSDNRLRKEMGENAFRTIRDKINLDIVSDRFIEAFKFVLE